MHPASINPLLKPLGAALACASFFPPAAAETQQASPGGAAPPAPTVGIVVATAEPVQLTTGYRGAPPPTWWPSCARR